METFDYVIVGAGSAGSVLANRLSEDAGTTVCVLEAGPRDKDKFIHIPLTWAVKLLRSAVDWDYLTEPQKQLNGRQIYWPRGKVLGGSSSINTQMWVRGFAADYDEWVSKGGATGWSYREVLPYFKRSENNQRFANEFHGYGGPLGVSNPISPLPICEAFFQAGPAQGRDVQADRRGIGTALGRSSRARTVNGGRRPRRTCP